MTPVLVTGATGNVGAPLVDRLRADGIAVRPAARHATEPDAVAFDFRDEATWRTAFDGVETMFLVRPPDISNVRADLLPSLTFARAMGLRHVVLLSVQGADRVPVLPHAKVEKWLRGSGMAWTFVRPSYFNQNLSTTFAADIRERDVITVPAGRGRTAFVDAVDVAEVAAVVLRDPAAHRNQAWTPTGPAMRYDEVAAILSAELGRTIRYTSPGIGEYARHARVHLHMPPSKIVVTTVLHTTARLGLAATETDDVRALTGHPPTPFAEFVRRERAVWLPAR